MRTTPTIAINTAASAPRPSSQPRGLSNPGVCICPSCGHLVRDEDLAAQGYVPIDAKDSSTDTGNSQYTSQSKAARVASGGEPDDDLAAQKTIADFNKGRSGNYAARPG